MRALGYAGRLFADLGVKAGFPAGMQNGPQRDPVTLQRVNESPLIAAMVQAQRVWTLNFTVLPGFPVEATLVNLLGALQVGSSLPRTMVAELRMGDGTAGDAIEVESTMTVGQYRFGSVNDVYIDFHADDNRWFRRLPTVLSPVKISGPTAIPLINHGAATVSPVIMISVDTQRASESSTVGWKYRKDLGPITNNSDSPWTNVRFTVELDHAALVTGSKSLANGDDLRVRVGQRELYRTITNPNTKRTHVQFAGTIPAGATATFELLYGNPDATPPRTLSTRGGRYDTYAADDLGGAGGTATAGTTGSLTDSGASWETDEWKDGFIGLVSGTGSTRYRRILSNTGTVITFNRTVPTAPDATTIYVLWKSGIFRDGGRVSSRTANTITDTAHTNKWAPGSLRGATVLFENPSGATPVSMTVQDNTTDTITFTTSFSVQPAVNDSFTITRWGVLAYHVDKSVTSTARHIQRGLWRTSNYSSDGGKTTFGDKVPGGWIPWLMVANNDQFAQLRVTDETAGASVANWPYLSARRRVRSDLTMPEKGAADGVCLYEPRGLVALDWDYRMENDNGIGAVVVMTQDTDGDEWSTIASDTTTRSSLAAVTSGNAAGGWSLIGDDEPVRLYLGIIPAGGTDSEIASTESKNRNAEVRSHTKMIVYLSVADVGGLSSGLIPVGSEEAIYDLHVTGRLGGGEPGEEVPTYYSFAAGGDGHYVHLGLTESLGINPSPTATAPLYGIYDSLGVLQEITPLAVQGARHELNLLGEDIGIEDFQLPLPPATNLVTGEDSTTGWTITNSAGVTASISNETATTFDGGASSLKVTVTTTPAGAWTITLSRALISVVPGAFYEFGFVRRRTSLTSAINVAMTVDFTATGNVATAGDGPETIGGPMPAVSTWYGDGTGHTTHAGSAITEPTTEAHMTIVLSGTGSTSGSVLLDAIAFGVPNLYLDEEEIGVLIAEIQWTEAFYA